MATSKINALSESEDIYEGKLTLIRAGNIRLLIAHGLFRPYNDAGATSGIILNKTLNAQDRPKYDVTGATVSYGVGGISPHLSRMIVYSDGTIGAQSTNSASFVAPASEERFNGVITWSTN